MRIARLLLLSLAALRSFAVDNSPAEVNDDSSQRTVTIGAQTVFPSSQSDTGSELWITDGTFAGTQLLEDIRPGIAGSDPRHLIPFNGRVFFSADDGVHGRELWATDGTASGTGMVTDLAPGADSSNPRNLVVLGSTLLFTAYRPGVGYTLWASDGTAGGTHQIADIDPSPTNDEFFYNWTNTHCVVGSTLFFNGNDPVKGSQLWRTDGTGAGTVVVLDVAGNQGGGAPCAMAALGELLYFNSRGDASSRLWVSDGTAAGTHAVVPDLSSSDSTTSALGRIFVRGTANGLSSGMWSIDSSGSATQLSLTYSEPSRFVAFGGRVYSDPHVPGYDRPLVASDGTPAGTVLVSGVNFDRPVVAGGTLYFASPGTTALELWRTDGTSAGTAKVTGKIADACPVGTVNGQVLVAQGNTLAGYTDLWVSDGTDAGTIRLLPKVLLSITGPTTSGMWWTKSPSVTISGTSTSSGPVTYQLSGATTASGTASGASTWSFTPSFSPGDTTVTVTAPGPSGSAAVSSMAVRYDLTPPTVAVWQPTSSRWYATSQTNVFVSMFATDNDAVASISYVLTGATTGTGYVSSTSSAAWVVYFTNLNPGVTMATFTATDRSGNTGTTTLELLIGTTAVAGQQPLPGGYLRRLLHLGSQQSYRITGSMPGGPSIALDDFAAAGLGPEYLQQPADGQTVDLQVASSETPMRWTDTTATRTDGIWDDGYGGDHYRQYYAMTLVAPSTRQARIAYWIDDRVRVWMDGDATPILAVDANGAGSSNAFTLTAGLHRFIFKYEQITSSSVFALRFTDTAGNDLTDLSYTLEDVIQPTVVAATPANGADHAPVTSAIEFTFSEPMDTSLAAASAAAISGSAPATGNWAWIDPLHLLWTPTAPLALSTTYTVTLAAQVTDRNANRLSGATSISFTTAVNAQPTLDPPATPLTLLEDATTTVVPLTGIGPGSIAEASQTLSVTAISSNPSVVPNPVLTYLSGNATGSLALTPVADANGSAVITVTVHDDGGTSGGGMDTVTRAFTVNVLPVNDAPRFTKGPDQVAAEDAGPQTIIGWASGISPGASNEGAQSLDFICSNDNPTLFSAQPSVSPSGTLTWTSAANAHGTAVVTVRIHDDGLTSNGGSDTSAPQTFVITVPAVNDPPVAANLSLHTTIDTAISRAFVATDADGDVLTYRIVSAPTHGAVSVSGQTATYTPAAGYSGSDRFTYRANDGTADSNFATVSITISAAPTGGGATAPSYTPETGGGGCGLGGAAGIGCVSLLLVRRRARSRAT